MTFELYRQYSPYMQSCDLIEWQAYEGVVGLMIQKITGRKANHTSIVLRPPNLLGFQDRRFLLEALGGGVVPRLLSYRLKDFKGQVRWLPLRVDVVKEEQLNTMIVWAVMECVYGKPYDYRSLFGNIAGKVSVNAEKWFCSEYATAMFVAGGLLPKDVKAYRPGEFNDLPFIGLPSVIYDYKRKEAK